MRGTLRSIIIIILILGAGLAIWQMSGGDIGGFFDAVGSILYTIIQSVATFFANLFGMFTAAG